MEISLLRRTAAEIAAAAVHELYPNVELLGGGESPTGFFYEFHCPHPIQVQLIEEKMRQIVRERREIRTLEMHSFSASELLKKEGHLARAEEIDEGMVEVIQIGNFYDLSEGPHLKNTAELAAFKIALEPGYKIVGYCAFSKEGLKQFLKKLDHYVEPQIKGEKMGLWKDDIWLSKGLRVKEQLIAFLRKHWFSDAYEILGPIGADRLALHRSMQKPKVGEIWVDPESGQTRLQLSFFDRTEEEMKSCLQSIGKTLTILGFDYVVEDELGRKWIVVEVKKLSKKDLVLTVEIEKMISLLLEKNLVLKMVEL